MMNENVKPAKEEWKNCLESDDPTACEPVRPFTERIDSLDHLLRKRISVANWVEKIDQVMGDCQACQQLLSRRGRQQSEKGQTLPCRVAKDKATKYLQFRYKQK